VQKFNLIEFTINILLVDRAFQREIWTRDLHFCLNNKRKVNELRSGDKTSVLTTLSLPNDYHHHVMVKRSVFTFLPRFATEFSFSCRKTQFTGREWWLIHLNQFRHFRKALTRNINANGEGRSRGLSLTIFLFSCEWMRPLIRSQLLSAERIMALHLGRSNNKSSIRLIRH